MITITPELACGLEHAEALHLRRQMELCQQLHPEYEARAIAIAGGVAAITASHLGRKLNHVTGFGMGEAAKVEDLLVLENAYQARELAVEVDLCPFADPAATALLAQRGFTVNAFSNTYVRSLNDDDLLLADTTGIAVSPVTAEESQVFTHASIAGFSVQMQRRPVALLEVLARIALGRADTQLYIARAGDTVLGSAGLALLETQTGRLAFLYIASVLPEYRGRGVQKALLNARLMAARRQGYDLAGITARPNNVSARNAQRTGFSLAYTKTSVVKIFR